MGYDQYTVRNDSSCRTYFCCFPLALANVSPWPIMLFKQISLENGADKTTHNTFRDCRVHFFPTTSLETTVYRPIKWKDLHDSDAAALLNDIKKIFWRTISKIRHFLMFHWMNHSPGSLMKNQYTCKLWQWAPYKTNLFADDKSSPQPNLALVSDTLLTV